MKKHATIASLNAAAAAVVLAFSASAQAAPASFALSGYDAS